MLANKLMSALSGAEEKLYVDDVFSAFTYTGNNSTQTINSGIDLAGKGGLVWIKGRDLGYSHYLTDTTRGASKILQSQTTFGQSDQSPYGLYEFLSSGFSVSATTYNGYNNNGATFVSWTFRKAPKFFDIVTYTGNGGGNRSISHSLGLVPGLIVIKRTDTSGLWAVYHRDLTYTQYLKLNATDAKADTANSIFGAQNPTASAFFVGTSADVNASGATYVAYLFAHDPSADGIIQCGSFTTDASGNATVNLGWEPQWLMLKRSNGVENWTIIDNMRGWTNSSAADPILEPNTSGAEYTGSNFGNPTATGFQIASFSASSDYIYIAIRRPNKPPTIGTEVFSTNTFNGSAGTKITTGFPVDLQVFTQKDAVLANHWADRLRGVSTTTTDAANLLLSTGTAAESTIGGWTRGFDNTGFLIANYTAGGNIVSWNFRRAPGFFDVVCYTGTGVARTVQHSLGVAPELMIVKSRTSATSNWPVYHSGVISSPANGAYLNLTNASLSMDGGWNSTNPTSSVFSVGGNSTNAASENFVAYLFASLPGIQKITSFVGNGSSQTIDCGFTTGARFVCIKATSTTGDWLIADTSRGIVAGSDPRLSLNTTAAEVISEDWLDPHASGFIVNQVTGSNANVNGVTYLVWAIA